MFAEPVASTGCRGSKTRKDSAKISQPLVWRLPRRYRAVPRTCARGKFLVTDGQPGVGGRFGQDDDQSGSGQGGASPSGVSRPLRRAGGISRRTTERPGKRPNSPVPASLRPPTVPPRDTRGRVVEVKPCLTGSFFAELLGRDRARDREPQSHRPASRSPQRAHRRHQSRRIAWSRCRGLPANRTGEVRVARRSSAHKRRGNKEA